MPYNVWQLRPKPQLSNSQINSIPEATNRKPFRLMVVDPGHIAIIGIQGAVPRSVGIVLGRTPPVTGLANAAECATVVTVTARKT